MFIIIRACDFNKMQRYEEKMKLVAKMQRCNIFFHRNRKNVYFCKLKRQPLYRWQSNLQEESPGSAESPYFLTGRGVSPQGARYRQCHRKYTAGLRR